MTATHHSSVRVGVSGVDIAPGDHICAFYPSLDERDEILLPFLQDGMEAGDKCVAVLDTKAPDYCQQALANGYAAGSGTAAQLQVSNTQETYLPDGAFAPDAMLGFWADTIGQAVADGYPFTRVVGEMTWALSNLPGVEELVSYEAKLNRMLPEFPQVVLLCLYELDRFDGEILVDVLKTHPKVLLGGILLDNPYYLQPEEFLANR